MRATDLGINFRKLVCDDNGSSYKSTCANEETVDKTGFPQIRELAYELSTKWVWALGLGWPDLTWTGVLRPAWVASELRALGCAWCVARLGAGLVLHRSPEQLLAGKEEGREKRRKGKKKKEKRKKKEREVRERERKEREKRRKF